jgi:hypothetical protein
LAIFVEYKEEILRTKVLRMTEKGRMINIRKGITLFRRSAAGEEFHVFIEFLTQHMNINYNKQRLKSKRS